MSAGERLGSSRSLGFTV